MILKNLLSEKRAAILGRWFEMILDSYPADTSSFLKQQKNQFANPVGAAISQGINGIFEELLSGKDSDTISTFLDNIIRVRAVQDFTPSQAVAFIFHLKKVIREELGKEISENQLSDELSSLEARIDKMAMLSFDIYVKCREKIYDIKANELRSMTFRLLQRANLICEVSEQEKELLDTKNLNVKRKEVTK